MLANFTRKCQHNQSECMRQTKIDHIQRSCWFRRCSEKSENVWKMLTLQTNSSRVLTSTHLYNVLPSTRSSSRYRSASKAAFICCTNPFWLGIIEILLWWRLLVLTLLLLLLLLLLLPLLPLLLLLLLLLLLFWLVLWWLADGVTDVTAGAATLVAPPLLSLTPFVVIAPAINALLPFAPLPPPNTADVMTPDALPSSKRCCDCCCCWCCCSCRCNNSAVIWSGILLPAMVPWYRRWCRHFFGWFVDCGWLCCGWLCDWTTADDTSSSGLSLNTLIIAAAVVDAVVAVSITHLCQAVTTNTKTEKSFSWYLFKLFRFRCWCICLFVTAATSIIPIIEYFTYYRSQRSDETTAINFAQ